MPRPFVITPCPMKSHCTGPYRCEGRMPAALQVDEQLPKEAHGHQEQTSRGRSLGYSIQIRT